MAVVDGSGIVYTSQHVIWTLRCLQTACENLPGCILVLRHHTFAVCRRSVSNLLIALSTRTLPTVFSYSIMHITRIKEAEYARTHLGAVGSGFLSNHEGKYLGNPLFTPFFEFLNSRDTHSEVMFVHPNSPTLDLNGTFISADPSKLAHFFLSS